MPITARQVTLSAVAEAFDILRKYMNHQIKAGTDFADRVAAWLQK